MLRLSNKVNDFKNHFQIKGDIDYEFKLDNKGNLIVVYGGQDHYLTNTRNPNKFLAISTMQDKLKYGIKFLRDMKIVAPKKAKVKQITDIVPLEQQIQTFREFHNITENIPELRIANNTLSGFWNNKWVAVSQDNKNKPLASTTLKNRYGAGFMDEYKIPKVKHRMTLRVNGASVGKQKAEINPLSYLPFNQYMYDKDFFEATNIFFRDETTPRPTDLILSKLPNPIRDYLESYQMIIPNSFIEVDPIVFFDEVETLILDQIKHALENMGALKYSMGLEVIFIKSLGEVAPGLSIPTDPPVRFYHPQIVVLNEEDINLDDIIAYFLEAIENFIANGSGWRFYRLSTLWLDFAKYEPIKGGSYLPLPKALKNKRAVINVENEDDNDCLRHALRSALFPTDNKHPERLSSYPKDDGLKFDGIDAPTPVSQVKKVEKMNKLSINVYGWERGKVIIHRLSDYKHSKLINVMIIEDSGKTHYVWIKHFNRLLASQEKNNHKHYCERCLIGFQEENALVKHMDDCNGIHERAIRIEMPTEKKKILKFQNHGKQLKSPWVMYADFEAITTKIEGPMQENTVSFTQRTQLHEACGFALRAVRSDGETIGPIVYRGPDAVQKFLEEAKKLEVEIKNMLKNREKKVFLTKEETIEYNKATTCWICEESGFETLKRKVCVFQEAVCMACARADSRDVILERPQDYEKYNKEKTCEWCGCGFTWKYKVRDHDHITGKYRGPAHCDCNLKLRIVPEKIQIPVFFHNLRNYDAHLIMQHIGETEERIKCIPNNMERYVSFSLGQLVFKDSAQFLITSLDKLVKTNSRSCFKFTEIGRTKEEFELLLRKGVYPYEYMDSWGRFEETQLPPIESFYSKLSGGGITKEDYEHAQKVWEVFNCKNMGDYHDLYLRTDVDLLTDVFEEFRKLCINTYKLDPANYYTSPGLSWDSLLKKTKTELELLTDYDIHLMVEKGLRGGISMVSERYAKANNPYVEGHDPTKQTSYISYFDANNLYGWAMVQYLPTGKFKWSNATISDILSHKADDKKGYICEVDMIYPENLHDAHNDYPLAPEKLEVQKEWLSDYQNKLVGGSLKVKKLVPNLKNKEKYVVHFRNLQLYVKLGMQVSKVHRVLEFEQSPWMAPYIIMNTELRKKAKSDFEKDFFKLMNNSVFGKTMENLRKRINIQLVRGQNDFEKLRKLIAKPSYARYKIFSNNLIAIHMYKDKLLLNRPIFVGMSILDLSKHLMYDYYYNDLKKQYGDACHLLYTDTDSLLLHIKTDDVYKDMQCNANLYDTSNFDKNHYLFNETNKKVLGKFKDECEGVPIKEYVGLRPKMYSIITADTAIQFRKAKGVKKCVVKKEITHENYKQSLFEEETFRHGMNMLRSDNHQIYGVHLNKISLSPLDTKRWIADDGVKTLAYGHYKIPSGGN